MTVDTELSETSENPVQNKVATEMLYDHELRIATIEESSDFKEFKLWSEQTLEAEVSSVEVNFRTNTIGLYPSELLVTLVVPLPRRPWHMLRQSLKVQEDARIISSPAAVTAVIRL